MLLHGSKIIGAFEEMLALARGVFGAHGLTVDALRGEALLQMASAWLGGAGDGRLMERMEEGDEMMKMTDLVGLLGPKFHICLVDISVTDSTHRHWLSFWMGDLVWIVLIELVLSR